MTQVQVQVLADAPPVWGLVIVAAGSGTRYGDPLKALTLLDGVPLLRWSLDRLARHSAVVQAVVVCAEHSRAAVEAVVGDAGLPHVATCLGGATRADSVLAGVTALRSDMSHVAVHDAARPFASPMLLTALIAAAEAGGAAIPVRPVTDTIHVASEDGQIGALLERDRLRAAQTPQAARRDWLLTALTATQAGAPSDEAAALVRAGYPVTLVDGEATNLKVTWPEDLVLAEQWLREGRVPGVGGKDVGV